MKTYYARLTWNNDAWRRPSGLIQRAERGTHVATRGFGHEEWLNRSEWTLDGWRYAYVEGVGRSPRLVGHNIRLLLFSINPRKERVFVGEISSASVLTDREARSAHRAFRARRWIATMVRELEDRVGSAKAFRHEVKFPSAVMNIRFRSAALRVFDSPVPVPGRHVLRRYSRYGLTEVSEASEKRYRERIRHAMKRLRSTAVRGRRAVKATDVDPIEARMENELRGILERHYGEQAVKAQENFVDLRVRRGRADILIELKSATDARGGIRQAIGQLLDYAFYENGGAKCRLVVVAQGTLTSSAERFIQTLQSRFRMPIEYRQYRPGSGQFELPS